MKNLSAYSAYSAVNNNLFGSRASGFVERRIIPNIRTFAGTAPEIPEKMREKFDY